MSIKNISQEEGRFVATSEAGFDSYSSTRFSSQKIRMNNFVDLSDKYMYQGAMIYFDSVGSYESAVFKAYITAFNESFSCDWASESVFGRADPIHMFKQVTRNCTLGFKIPCATPSESYEAMHQIDNLRACLYPNYESHNDALTISSSPLVRIEVLQPSLINTSATTLAANGDRNSRLNTYDELFSFGEASSAGKGALAIIKNLQISYNLENGDVGVFEGLDGDTDDFVNFVAKQFEITLDFTLIHEVNPGRTKRSDGTYKSNYNQYQIDVLMTASGQDSARERAATAAQTAADAARAEEEAASQAAQDEQQAGFFKTMISDFRSNRASERYGLAGSRRGEAVSQAMAARRPSDLAQSTLAQNQMRAERIQSLQNVRAAGRDPWGASPDLSPWADLIAEGY